MRFRKVYTAVVCIGKRSICRSAIKVTISSLNSKLNGPRIKYITILLFIYHFF